MKEITLGMSFQRSPFGNFLAVALLVFVPTGASAACISSGTDRDIQAVLKSGNDARLCQRAVFNLEKTIKFEQDNQKIFTAGLPSGNRRALLQIASPEITGAINGVGWSGIAIRNVRVKGRRPLYGYKPDQDALIKIGGDASGQRVENVKAWNTRSWSTLHIIEGGSRSCTNATIVNNVIGPAGTASTGVWADGISLSCRNSWVQRNEIVDATDGGIVVFGAPGSVIEHNTIRARSRDLLGGINMVDRAGFDGNYDGTVVRNNTVSAEGAFIKIGVAMGPGVWSCTSSTVHGGTVTGNTLQGSPFGYGYVVDGVSGWTVSGNISTTKHNGTANAACGTANHPPAAFIKHGAHASGTFQGSFVEGIVHGGTEVTQ